MTAPAQRPSWYRARWVLPVVLAILVIILVVAVVFGKQIKNAIAGPTPTPTVTATPMPTATPKTIVVTATATAAPVGPGTPSPTPNVAGAPTATPGGNGASTPLPGATPFPTIPGLKLGEITRTTAQVASIQAGADRKDPKYTYYLNPVLVVQKNLGYYGFTQPFTVQSPPATPTPTPTKDQLNRPLVRTYVLYQNRKFEVDVAQPGKTGPTGVWVIVTIKQIG